MKIVLRRPEPTLPAAVLTYAAREPDLEDLSEIQASRHRTASAELIEIEALVAHINDFWLTQPALRHLGQPK